MSTAHLYPVPDPDDSPATEPAEAPGPGPARATPGERYVQDQPATEAGDELEKTEQGEAAGARPRAFALPDLRPYVPDRRTAHEFGSLAVGATKATAPRIRQGLAPVCREAGHLLRAGSTVLVLVGRGWLAGQLCPKVSPLPRFLFIPAVVGAAIVHTLTRYSWTGAVLLIPGWLITAAVAERWAALQVARAAKAPTSGKDARKDPRADFTRRLAAALQRPAAELPAESSPEVLAEPVPEPAGEPVDEPGVETSAAAGQEPEEEPAGAPAVEAPPAPSREDIVRALHALVGGSSGVLHTALRDHLRYPSTRALREALETAGIPSRAGVRSMRGNGPGVHRSDVPQLPGPQEAPAASGVVAGQEPTPTTTTAEGTSEEGVRVVRTDYGGVTYFDLSERNRFEL
ncbi:hypothetical protein [Streptomyces fuscigenes]|uniref:hypothetical protein n=1 Tax=Streptomyces fuscigenes TaxID=1528880 RepID=UPI001F26BA1C|nr:hypothetical protein [Streptomyces fuscigenes]MCF3960303.1 hypothetical protein [Streptomyces fuscigenes]